jgi:hypothetical protein
MDAHYATWRAPWFSPGLPWSGSSWDFYALGLCLLFSAAVRLFLWSTSRR